MLQRPGPASCKQSAQAHVLITVATATASVPMALSPGAETTLCMPNHRPSEVLLLQIPDPKHWHCHHYVSLFRLLQQNTL